MSDKYYYLVASLPYLEFGKKAPIGKEEFLAECGKWLSEKELGLLEASNAHSPEPRAFLACWREFDNGLREALGWFRKNTHGKTIPQILNGVFKQDNPLEKEIAFERIRWQFLEDEEATHHFDITKIIIYFLKLRILLRLDTFNKEKGKAALKELCAINY
ncbi:MAG: DUF2764 family protein [Candidatus Omnitrophota bacterium]